MSYVTGVDIGGTFTDCAIVDADGRLFPGKAPTSPEDRTIGFFASLASAAQQAGVGVEELLTHTDRLLHGTTVATNALVERKGAKVGLVTTRGHRDVILMMRGSGRTAGRPVGEIMDLANSNKPVPLVPRRLIREVDERVDFSGEVIVPLDVDQARLAVESLLAAGVEAICVSFLWSFQNPSHEEALVAMIEEMAPGLFVTAAHRLVSKWGEYERTVGAVINSFVGPTTKRYLDATSEQLRAASYEKPFLIMQSTGGLAPVAECAQAPLLTVGSGPVGGLEGVRFLAGELGIANAIGADMGGTTFDVGLIVDGQPVKSATTIIGQYQYALPVVDLQSIGSGGGSIAWIDELSHSLRVGPRSAGAEPGPACYGRGGAEPTITDANVVLGYLDPEHFLGGKLPLDSGAAHAAVSRLASRLDMTVQQAASGVVTIAEHQMADLIRRMTMQKGFDPREFVLVAYGGAGPVHAAVIARELGIARVIVPLGEAAGAWSALGVASANVLRVFERTQVTYEPFDADAINAGFVDLEEQARQDLQAQGFDDATIDLRRFAAMQYGWQVHQVDVPVPAKELVADDMPRLITAFEERYARLYGEGAGFRQAGVRIIDIRVEGVGITPKPVLSRRADDKTVRPVAPSLRDVYWPDTQGVLSTAVYRGKDVVTDQTLAGPAIVEQDFTTIVVHPDQHAVVDAYGNIVIYVQKESSTV